MPPMAHRLSRVDRLSRVGSLVRVGRVFAAIVLVALPLGVGSVAGVAASPMALAKDLPPSQIGVNVYDFAGIWSAATRQQAQAIVTGIHDRTQAEIAVVSWPSGEGTVSLGGAQVDARLIMDTWGVGRKGVNDGLVVLFDMDTSNQHGQIYLATGQGFQQLYLSDAEAQAIVNGDMLPRAKAQDLDGALLSGLQHLDRIVQPGGNPERSQLTVLRNLGAGLAFAVGLVVIGLFVRAWWRRGRDAAVPLIDDSVLLPEPPPALTPALATVLRKDLVSREALTSALVDLGHRGLLTFKENGDNPKDIDLEIPQHPLDDDASKAARDRRLGVAEHGLATFIDEQSVGGVLTHEALREGKGQKIYDDFRKHIGIAAATSGWFRDDPNRVVRRWMLIGVGFAIAAGVLLFVAANGDPAAGGADGSAALSGALLFDVFAGIAIAVLSRYIAARTPAGAQTLAMALAYRNTLRYEIANAQTLDAAVESTKRRLPWVTTPDLLTVWAVALGLNDEVDKLIRESFAADQSAGRTGWSPLWFSGASWGSGGFLGFGGGGLAGAVASVSVSSTSGSGGGFGGGFSGGGGGAGGGF
jgi:uncharacterized membrane protein YgcG